MRERLRSTALVLATGAFVFYLDQGSKALWFELENDQGRSTWHLIRLTAHANYGISFNLPLPLWIPIGLALVIALGTLILAATRPRLTLLALLGLGFVLGGALGNGFDRVSLGFVRDWLLWFELSAINLADIAIVAGCVLFWKTYSKAFNR